MSRLVAFYDSEPLKSREVAVKQIDINDAPKFELGNEPFLTKVIYVAHPRDERRLIPFGQFEDHLMMDKFNEALRIVQVLGAYEVITQTYRGDLSKVKVRAAAGPLDPSGEISKHGSRDISFQQYGTGGPPQDPSPILWPDEPGFEAARRAVLFNGSHEVSITIESRSAFKIDSDIALGLKKAGFRLGVTSEKEQLQLLRLVAHFPMDGSRHQPLTRSEREARATPALEDHRPGAERPRRQRWKL